jgi:anti-sigma regulatory factor (Ser/Thr protein kinase)
MDLDPGQVGGPKTLELTLPPEFESVPKARHAVAAFAEGCDADPYEVALAVSEAVGNAVLHAYRFGLAEGEIRVRAARQEGQLCVSVEDDGLGMRPDLKSEGLGFGSTLIASSTSEVRYEPKDVGVRLTMYFPCQEPALA